MKNILSALVVLFSLTTAFAALDSMILVQGQINSFDKTNIQATDDNGQKVIVPKSAFPKKFELKQGKHFSVEVTEKVFDSLNQPLKKKNK